MVVQPLVRVLSHFFYSNDTGKWHECKAYIVAVTFANRRPVLSLRMCASPNMSLFRVLLLSYVLAYTRFLDRDGQNILARYNYNITVMAP